MLASLAAFASSSFSLLHLFSFSLYPSGHTYGLDILWYPTAHSQGRFAKYGLSFQFTGHFLVSQNGLVKEQQPFCTGPVELHLLESVKSSI